MGDFRAHVMILCAGLGQRLRPLTNELPKPLLPVGDRSVLAHIAAQVARAGYPRAVANSHWLHEQLASVVAGLPLALHLVYEPSIRGVAGAVAGARPWLEAPVVVWNGDVLLDTPPLEPLLAAAAASGNICLAVAKTHGPGSVGLDDAGRVVRVRGEVYGRETQRADYCGIFGIGERALAELPDEGCIIGDYCMPRLRRGEPVQTLWLEGAWLDIGTLESYFNANQQWLRDHGNHAGDSYVAASARLNRSVSVSGSIVGAGASVLGTGAVRSCVVWPDATVQAPLERAIVTPTQIVALALASTP